MKDEDKFSKLEPQPSKEKGYEASSPIALMTCRHNLEGVEVELVEGQPIVGLTRQEREYLRFHGRIT